MGRLIEEEVLIRKLAGIVEKYDPGYRVIALDLLAKVANAIMECPTAGERRTEPERPKGQWVEHIHFDAFGSPNGANYECPVCHYDDVYDETDYNFCPNCGADMRGESE